MAQTAEFQNTAPGVPAKPKTLQYYNPYAFFDHGAKDYRRIYVIRDQMLRKVSANPRFAAIQRAYYTTHPVEFIQDWGFTFNPKNVPKKKPALIPFIFWPRQIEFILWLKDRYENQEDGVIDKARELGVTWLCVAFACWLWQFHPDSVIGFGSNKLSKVDSKGDPDSILEKVRIFLRHQPPFLMPEGYNEEKHAMKEKILNKENGSIIRGEGGDDIGRGGRASIYFKDESAFYERPIQIDAALSGTADCKIDLSTHNGPSTEFYKKTRNPAFNKFEFDWFENPDHDMEKFQYMEDTMDPINFAQEVLRDPDASVEGICIPRRWLLACVDLKISNKGPTEVGLDVSEEDGDGNCVIGRRGPVILAEDIKFWKKGNTDESAQHAYAFCKLGGFERLKYDVIGVGSGTRNEINKTKYNIEAIPIDVRNSPAPGYYKDDRKNSEHFLNLKAQMWWNIRDRAYRTFQHVNGIKLYPDEKLLSIPYHETLINELCSQQYKLTNGGKIVMVDKVTMKKLTRMESRNHAEALCIAFCPNIQRVCGGW